MNSGKQENSPGGAARRNFARRKKTELQGVKGDSTFLRKKAAYKAATGREYRSVSSETTTNSGWPRDFHYGYWYLPAIPPKLPRTTRIFRTTDP